jgi:hypothetical protein
MIGHRTYSPIQAGDPDLAAVLEMGGSVGDLTLVDLSSGPVIQLWHNSERGPGGYPDRADPYLRASITGGHPTDIERIRP